MKSKLLSSLFLTASLCSASAFAATNTNVTVNNTSPTYSATLSYKLGNKQYSHVIASGKAYSFSTGEAPFGQKQAGISNVKLQLSDVNKTTNTESCAFGTHNIVMTVSNAFDPKISVSCE